MRVGPPLSEDLRAALGSPAMVRRLPSSPRSRVWLAEFDGTPAIIKQITGGADADARFAREVTALGLARRVRPFVVPGVLGTDPGGRVMVLEYLTELGRAPAPDWMTEYATALARLHAATGPDDAGRGGVPGDVAGQYRYRGQRGPRRGVRGLADPGRRAGPTGAPRACGPAGATAGRGLALGHRDRPAAATAPPGGGCRARRGSSPAGRPGRAQLSHA